jgi:hypothetical protein
LRNRSEYSKSEIQAQIWSHLSKKNKIKEDHIKFLFSEKNTINFTHIRVSCESRRNLGEDQKRFIAEEGAKLFHQGNPYHVPKRPKFYILDVRM